MNVDLSKNFFKIIPNSMSLVRCYIKMASKSDFGFSKFRILANISRGVNTTKEISELHGVSQPAISKLVDGLVNEDLVSRHYSSKDRRVIKLRLTSLGVKKHKKIISEASRNFEPSLDLLSEKEAKELQRALRTLDLFFEKIQERKKC